MQYDDTDPHRRNLIITSLGFIIYFYGGGKIANGEELKLSLVNVTLSNPEFVGWAAVTIFIWFLFRYWQKSPHIRREFKADLKHSIQKSFWEHHLSKGGDPKKSFLCGNIATPYRFFWLTPQISRASITHYQLRGADSFTQAVSQGRGTVGEQFNLWRIWIIATKAQWITLVHQQSFFDLVFPWVIAAAAAIPLTFQLAGSVLQ